MIYFAQDIDGGPVKIGHSCDVPARLRQLEMHYGRPLALLAVRDGGPEEERAIHERFAHLRFGRTEQFLPVAELMTFLERPLLVSPNPESVEAMPATPQSGQFTIKGTPEWKAWVAAAAAHERTSVAEFLDRAAVVYARQVGFDREVPRR